MEKTCDKIVSLERDFFMENSLLLVQDEVEGVFEVNEIDILRKSLIHDDIKLFIKNFCLGKC